MRAHSAISKLIAENWWAKKCCHRRLAYEPLLKSLLNVHTHDLIVNNYGIKFAQHWCVYTHRLLRRGVRASATIILRFDDWFPMFYGVLLWCFWFIRSFHRFFMFHNKFGVASSSSISLHQMWLLGHMCAIQNDYFVIFRIILICAELWTIKICSFIFISFVCLAVFNEQCDYLILKQIWKQKKKIGMTQSSWTQLTDFLWNSVQHREIQDSKTKKPKQNSVAVIHSKFWGAQKISMQYTVYFIIVSFC